MPDLLDKPPKADDFLGEPIRADDFLGPDPSVPKRLVSDQPSARLPMVPGQPKFEDERIFHPPGVEVGPDLSRTLDENKAYQDELDRKAAEERAIDEETSFARFVTTPITHHYGTTAPQLIEKIPGVPFLKGFVREKVPGGKYAVGAIEGVQELGDSFASPLGIATLGMGMMPKAAQRVVSLAFAADMAKNLPEQAGQLKEAIDSGDKEKVAKASVGLAGNAVFATLAAKHGLTFEGPGGPPSGPTTPVEPAAPNRIAPELRTQIAPKATIPETILPQAAAEAAKITPKAEVPSAGEVSKTAAVHGDVLTPPVEGAGKVPKPQGGPGVQPQAPGRLPEAGETPSAGAQPEPHAVAPETPPALPLDWRKVADLPAVDFDQMSKQHPKGVTGWAYDLAKQITPADFDAINAEASRIGKENLKRIMAGEAQPAGSLRPQLLKEAVRMRQALDEAVSTDANTDAQLAAIARKYGVGAGGVGDDASYAKTLRDHLDDFKKTGKEVTPVETKKEEAKGVLSPQQLYDAALEKSRAASKAFSEKQKAYRDRTIGDDEFLKAKAEHDAAQKEMDAAEKAFVESQKKPAAPPAAPTPPEPKAKIFKAVKGSRPSDIVDEWRSRVGLIRNKKYSKPGSEGFYSSGYKEAIERHGPGMFGKNGLGPDDYLGELKRARLIKPDATVDDMWDIMNRTHRTRQAHYRGETPEAQADKFYSAMDKKLKQKNSQKLTVGELGVGDKFTVNGQEFEIKSIDPDTGEVTAKDGKKFGWQTIPDGADIAVDKGSYEPAAEVPFEPETKPEAPKPDLTLGAPETVKQQNARLEQERRAAEIKAAEDAKAAAAATKEREARERLAGRIGGNLGEAGQGDLLGGTPQSEMFKPPPPKPPGEELGPPMGADVLGAGTPSRQGATGIKNAAVDEARQARGEEPLMAPSRLANPVVWDRTMARIDADPAWQDRLIQELREAPRTLTPEETIAMDHRYVDMQNEYAKTTRELASAYDESKDFPNRAEAIPELQARLQAQSDALYEFEQITQKVGTEWGRSGQIRQRLLNEDFSLASMTILKRAANEGRPLTEAEQQQIAKLHDTIQQLQQKLTANEAARIARESEIAAQKALDELKRGVPQMDPVVKRIVDRIGNVLHTQRDAALARIKARGPRLMTGLDPTELADYTIVGASHLFDGALDFGKWSARMLGELGDAVKPHLQQIFQASNEHFDKQIDAAAGKQQAPRVRKQVKDLTSVEKIDRATEQIQAKVKAGKRDELTAVVQRLARAFVERGVTERDALIDAVHGVLSGVDPGFTRRQTMDAISGYGEFKPLSKDQISVKLRDLKRQMQNVSKLEDMQAGKPPLKTGVQLGGETPSPELQRLIKEVNRSKQEFQIPVTDPNTQLKSALDTLKTRMANRIVELQDKLAKGDFATKSRKAPPQDAESVRLSFQLDKAKRAFHEGLMKDRLARRSKAQKVIAGGAEAINTLRAMQTSIDLSAVLRQGGFVTLGHPIRALKAFPDMLKAMVSPEQQHRVMEEIYNRPNAPLYRSSKLYLSDQIGKLSQMEEAYMSRWAEKIPGVAASQRAYTTFLNRLRADSFDAMAAGLARGETPTPVEARAIANYINKATGRGSFGGQDTANVALNTVFFSPRYLASRLQMLAGQPLYGGTARTRVAIAKEYARFLAGVGAVYALGLAAGGKVEDDPRSSDFGKLRFGQSRVDPLTGLLQVTTLVSRVATGQTKTPKGKIEQLRPSGTKKVPFGGSDTVDVLARFMRSKLSPSVGLGVDVAEGKDFAGNPVTAGSVAQNLVTPIAVQDVYQAMKAEGVPEGTALGLLALFGMGVQTYDEKKRPTAAGR